MLEDILGVRARTAAEASGVGAPPERSGNQSMSTETSEQKKGIDLPTHAQYVGRDGQGFEHYYSGYESTIYVVKAQKKVHVQRFSDFDGLGQWIQRIQKRDGWEELQYYAGQPAEFIAERLEEAEE